MKKYISLQAAVILTLLLPCLGIGTDAEDIIAISKLTQELVNQVVHVEGEVVEIDYRPLIRNGVTYYSLRISDGSGEVMVRDPMAAMFSEGDVVAVTGILREEVPRGGTEGNDPFLSIDCLEGEIKALSSAEPRAAWNEYPDLAAQAVPVSTVATPWTRTVDLATLLSALFAAIAAWSIVLRRRRFSLKLVRQSSYTEWVVDSENKTRLRVELRVASTGSSTPWLKDEARLCIGLRSIRAVFIRILEADTHTFPCPVGNSCSFVMEFSIPKTVSDHSKGRLVLYDAFSGKRFRFRLGKSSAHRAESGRGTRGLENGLGEGVSGGGVSRRAVSERGVRMSGQKRGEGRGRRAQTGKYTDDSGEVGDTSLMLVAAGLAVLLTVLWVPRRRIAKNVNSGKGETRSGKRFGHG